MPQPFRFFTPGSIDFGDKFIAGRKALGEERERESRLESQELERIALQQQAAQNAPAQRLQTLQNQLGIDDVRTQALFDDAKTARSLFGISPERSASFLSNRASLISQTGGNPQDTLEVVDLIRSGDTSGARSLLDSVVKAGIESGALKPSPQAVGKKTPEQIERELVNSERITSIRESELDARIAESSRKAIQLTPTTQKMLDKAQTAAFNAQEQFGETKLLADDFATLVSRTGAAGKFSESLKTLLGSEDAVSDIKRRFRSIRASSVVQNLPPGAASDKDIDLALSGFPSENAAPSAVESFLRGQAKLSAIQQEFQTLRATSLSDQGNTKGLLNKWKQLSSSEDFLRGINEMVGISPATQTPQPLQQPAAPNQVGRFTVEAL